MNIFNTNTIDIAERVVHLLSRQKLKISFAESCTGGLVSAAITEIPGASTILNCSFITYSPHAKNSLLLVNSNLIETYGTVSREVTEEMAKGALKKAASDIAVAVTGIAGPSSDEKMTPIGLIYIAIVSTENICEVFKYNFSGSRHDIRIQAVDQALHEIIKFCTPL